MIFWTGSNVVRAKLAVTESGGIIAGQPVRVTKYPRKGMEPDDTHICKICPDGERPDGVCVNAFDDSGSVGAIAYTSTARLLIRIGAGGVAAATPSTCPLLKVSGGAFVVAGAGERGYVRPFVEGGVALSSGDLVNAMPSEGVA